MAKIRNTKNCSYRIDGVSLTPEYGELEIDDERANELCRLDGIEIVNYDEEDVPVLVTSAPVDFDPIPDEDTKVETPKKKRRSKKGKRSK